MHLETGKQLLGKGVLAGLAEKTGRGQDSDGDTVPSGPVEHPTPPTHPAHRPHIPLWRQPYSGETGPLSKFF